MRSEVSQIRFARTFIIALVALAVMTKLSAAPAQDSREPLSATSRLPDPSAPPLEEVAPPEEPIAIADEGWDMWQPAFWDPWEGNVELGLNGTDGNTQTFNIRLGALAKRKTEFRTQQLQVTSIQKRAGGATTANTALIDSRIDWPMPSSRFNAFVHNLNEYDQFKAFDWRVSGDAGIGYEWVQNDFTALISRVGASASYEIGGPNDKVNPEILLGGEYKHKFNELHQVSAEVSYYPNISDFADYRVNSQAAWQVVLSQQYNLSLKMSIIDRYDSTPQGKRPNDLDYSTLLLWAF